MEMEFNCQLDRARRHATNEELQRELMADHMVNERKFNADIEKNSWNK